jgi:hypothetical protein
MQLITKPPVVDHRPILQLAYRTTTARQARQIAQREVLQTLNNAHEKVVNNPSLSKAFYDAVTLLLNHWTPGDE